MDHIYDCIQNIVNDQSKIHLKEKKKLKKNLLKRLAQYHTVKLQTNKLLQRISVCVVVELSMICTSI